MMDCGSIRSSSESGPEGCDEGDVAEAEVDVEVDVDVDEAAATVVLLISEGQAASSTEANTCFAAVAEEAATHGSCVFAPLVA